MEQPSSRDSAPGFPELTELGKYVEVLRIERGLSKQALAKRAGTSRQQLWRVMTGKSELTAALELRLAGALQVPSLSGRTAATRSTTIGEVAALDRGDRDRYLRDASAIERTLATLPAGDAGRALKRRFLDVLEDCAMHDGHALDGAFFDLRRRVLAGEL